MTHVLPPNSNHKIVRVDVRGEDPELWKRLRAKLMVRIHTVLESTLDHDRGTTVREEAKQFTASMLDFARQRLQREGLENDKIEAEIAELYAKRTKELADADRVSAEAERIRQDTSLRELCKCLALTKAMLIGDESEEAMLFGQQIDSFLSVVKELCLISGA